MSQGLKHAINLINHKDQHEAMKAQIGLKIVKFGLIGSEFIATSLSLDQSLIPFIMSSENHESDNEQKDDSGTNEIGTTSIHVMALDEVVSANSLFTAAVFVGLSLTSPSQLQNNSLSSCNAGPDIVRNVIVFEVASFSCFLFSSLVAQGLKLGINLINSNDREEAFKARVNTSILKTGLIGSAIGSILGCVFLLLSMVYVIQIKLGLVSCGGEAAVRAVTSLVVLVGSSLVLYVWTIFYSLTH
ncbi:hypothetical protein LUZ60_016082 [Juncus effusus]|nr:hypothetical protein LUZ60_016082 [Juncus effusus]